MPPHRRPVGSPRDQHRALLVERLRRHGRSSRADLVAASGLSRGTVSGLVAELVADGEVAVVADRAGSQAGRPPELLTLDPAAGLLVGIDFGHRRVLTVAVDAAHDVLGWRRRTYPRDSSWQERCSIATAAVRELLASTGASPPLAGVGLGVPGGMVHRQAVLTLIRTVVGSTFDVPVREDNNARLAGLAEATWGAARSATDLAYLRISNGVGGALLLDGRVHSGAGDLGGELGHVCVEPDGLICRCTKRGCLESRIRLEQVLLDAGCASIGELRERVAAGEATAVAVVTRAGRLVSEVLAVVGTALDLRHVVLAGELVSVGAPLLDPVREALAEQYGVGPTGRQVVVVPAELGDQAGALGAIAMLLQDPTVTLDRHRSTPTHKSINS